MVQPDLSTFTTSGAVLTAPLWGPGSPKGGSVSGHRKTFISHMYKYAVLGIKSVITSKFSSQVISYTYQKFYLGTSGGITLTGGGAGPLRTTPISLRFWEGCEVL